MPESLILFLMISNLHGISHKSIKDQQCYNNEIVHILSHFKYRFVDDKNIEYFLQIPIVLLLSNATCHVNSVYQFLKYKPSQMTFQQEVNVITAK